MTTNIPIPNHTIVKLNRIEQNAILAALAHHKGNRTHAAKALGIGIRTLQRKLLKYGVPNGNATPIMNSPIGEDHGAIRRPLGKTNAETSEANLRPDDAGMPSL